MVAAQPHHLRAVEELHAGAEHGVGTCALHSNGRPVNRIIRFSTIYRRNTVVDWLVFFWITDQMQIILFAWACFGLRIYIYI